MKKMARTKVIIRCLPPPHLWSYFMWFLFGFYELDKNHIIDFKFKSDLGTNLASKFSDARILDRIKKYIHCGSSVYCMQGDIIIKNNGIEKRKKFVIDCADSPHVYELARLKECDIYFKINCPKDFIEDGFYLTPSVKLPWTDKITESEIKDFLKYSHKIRPLMQGPRRLANGISYKLLKAGYDNFLESRAVPKPKNLMCYFGNSLGPIPKQFVVDEHVNFDSDSHIMGAFKDVLSHPNEKRAIACKFIKDMGPKELYDARVIMNSNSDISSDHNQDIPVPLEQFPDHVASFKYNLNISGYRKSIPSRFIESFVSGTAIVSDKLSVRWYHDFGDEVFETVEMGYIRNDDVDWTQFKYDLCNLPKISKDTIIENYEKYWSPVSVCKYILNTVIGD